MMQQNRTFCYEPDVWRELTGGGEIQIVPAGGQDSGIDPGDHVGLIHDKVHHIMITV